MAAHKSKDNVHIGLDAKQRASSVGILSKILANQSVLRTKTQNCHWNVEGPQFPMLHEFFERQYDGLTEAIDETAERIRMLGAPAPGSMAEFLKLASLKEASGVLRGGTDALRFLLDDHEKVVRELREAVEKLQDLGDTGNTDYLTKLLQDHEKTAWMIRSCLR